MFEIAIGYALEIVATLLITLIGVGGAWLAAKLGKRTELANITAATEQVILAAQTTVGELQQTLVEKWKAEGGGKLNETQKQELADMLLSKTKKKLAPATVALLEAATVDVTALIVGAGEDWIGQMKG